VRDDLEDGEEGDLDVGEWDDDVLDDVVRIRWGG